MTRVYYHQIERPSPTELTRLLEFARSTLGASQADFIDGGALRPHIIMGSCSSPASWTHSYDRNGVCLYRPTAAEQRQKDAWLAYRKAVGGKVDPSDPAKPTFPRESAGTWRGLTWLAVRRELRAARSPAPQLALFDLGHLV